MQVIVTYSECALAFRESENYSPGNNRSDGGVQWKTGGSRRTTWNLSTWNRILLCLE